MSQNAERNHNRNSAPTSERKAQNSDTDVSPDDPIGVAPTEPSKPPSTAPMK